MPVSRDVVVRQGFRLKRIKMEVTNEKLAESSGLGTVDDPSLEEYFEGEISVPKTIGNFLRDFTDEDIVNLQKFLTKMGYGIRKHVKKVLEGRYKVEDKPRYNVDSTFHVQHGDKIEGCAINYQG